MAETTAKQKSSPKVVIVGAGIGGVTCAIKLKRELGLDTFTVYEQHNGIGGTWLANTYPGCSADVPSILYSLSTDLNPDWSCSHAFQPEIKAYWEGLVKKYSLTSKFVFDCKVVEAVWNPSAYCYHITIEDMKTGQQSATTADILISAIGVVDIPKYPDIQGLSEFKGDMFHSARWKDITFDNKRVAVIGNGSSATQLLPVVAKAPGVYVTQFCRTPSWYSRLDRIHYSRAHKLACRYLPLYMLVLRFFMYLKQEIFYIFTFSNNLTRRPLVAKPMLRNMLKHVPQKYRNDMIPNYEIGCKRVVLDSGYLSALHKGNVEVQWRNIGSVVEDGIVTKEGKLLTFDIIVLATGFVTQKFPFKVVGKDSQIIQDYYESKGGPHAYYGTCVPNFPNFFMISGPNTTTGHISFVFTSEIQAKYIIQLIEPIMRGRVLAVDVKTEPTDVYSAKVQAKLARSIFADCNSWYRVDGHGKIITFLGSHLEFWWKWYKPKWADFQVVKPNVKEGSRNGFLVALGVTVAAATALVSLVYG